jgi:hypothetical protein
MRGFCRGVRQRSASPVFVPESTNRVNPTNGPIELLPQKTLSAQIPHYLISQNRWEFGFPKVRRGPPQKELFWGRMASTAIRMEAA